MSDEARLFLLKEKLTELRRKKRYASILLISPFVVAFMWVFTGLPDNITIRILITIVGTIFSMFTSSYYMHTRSEEKKIMQQIEEMAYGKTTEP